MAPVPRMAIDRGTDSGFQMASLLVQYWPSSIPSIGGVTDSLPVARTIRSASISVQSASSIRRARSRTARKSTSTAGTRTPKRSAARASAAILALRSMTLVGTQPYRLHSPPSLSRSARPTASAPFRPSRKATSEPVAPPPITKTSNRSTPWIQSPAAGPVASTRGKHRSSLGYGRRGRMSRSVIGNALEDVSVGRILLVDDEPRILDFVRRGLQAEGFSVDVASVGEEGLRMAVSQPYDLVILDLVMPM